MGYSRVDQRMGHVGQRVGQRVGRRAGQRVDRCVDHAWVGA